MKFGKKAKKRLLITLAILAPLTTFLLWPLDDPKYDIVFDEEKIKYREDYLAQKVSVPDSVERPNIIIILADDLSKMDVSLYGGKHVKTKHMDAIGQNGVTFQEAYITSPVCAPSRAGMLTGRYQQRFGFEINTHERYPNNRLEYYVYKWFIASGDWQVAKIAVPSFEEMYKQGLPPSEILLPEVLRKHGYATAMMGKWHLGYSDMALPLSRGFDYHYGFYQAFSLYGLEDDPNMVNQKLTDFSDSYIWGKARTGNCAIRRNTDVIEEEGYLTTRIAEESMQWMEEHKDEPFFMYIPFSAPHTPFQATKEYYDMYKEVKDPKKRIYYAMIHALDDAVGMIMNKLKELELEENTIVFFLSDNGGATYTLAADNSPLKGGKMSNFEGGINVPFMIQWKGKIPAGMQYLPPVSSLDIFATSMDLAKCEVPNRKLDGVNIMPYLLDSTYQNKLPHEILYWRAGDHKAIRKGSWKMIKDTKSNQSVLYNIQNDKYEKNNVLAEEPKTIEVLENELKKWESQMIDSRWPKVMDMEIRDGEMVYYFPL